MMNPYDQMFSQPREFLLLSASPTSTQLCYDAEIFTVPSRGELVMPNPDRPFKPHSGKDSEGNWIPGSLLVKDIPGQRGCPDEPKDTFYRPPFWSASAAIMHCLGIDARTKQPTSSYSENGIGLLGLNPTPELVASMRKELHEKGRKFRLKNADEVIATYKAQANKLKQAGLEPGIPGEDYDEALLVRAEEKKAREERLEALGISDPLKEDSAEEPGLLELARQVAQSMAKEQPSVDMDELVKILMQKPEFKKALKQEYKVRKLSKGEQKDAASFGGA